MASIGDLKGRVVIENSASAVLTKIRSDIDGIANASKRVSLGQFSANAYRSAANGLDRMSRSTTNLGVAAAAAGFSMRGLLESARGFNASIWGAQAAFLGNDKNDAGKKFESDGDRMAYAREQAVKLREAATELSRAMGVMPENLSKAGMEAVKMGLDYAKAKAVMKASALVQMSDVDAKAEVITKALGSYNIIYGAPADGKGYDETTRNRASMLALAGAKTRTSASKIEEGTRNYMGIHGAFGGQFEDMVALIANATQIGQLEKEAGTSLRSLQGRFLNMPVGGRSALAGSGIDVREFMDFTAVDPLRATNQLVQMFPQQLGKGARGKMVKFLEQARADKSLGDPQIINRTLHELEKNGLKFAGDQDRENAVNKITAVMSGAGGKFDMIGAFAEVAKAIKEGRATPAIWASLGVPQRMHQNAGFTTTIDATKKLRGEMLDDKGKYLDVIGGSYGDSEAGRLERLEASIRRLQVALVNSEGIQSFVQSLADIAGWVEKLDPAWMKFTGTLVASVATLTAVGLAVGLVAKGMKGFAAIPGLGAAGKLAWGATGIPAGVAGLGALGGWALGRAGVLSRGATVGAPIGLGAATAGGAGIMGVQAARSVSALSGLKAIALGAGRLLIPGIGIISLGAMGYGAYEGYNQTGTVGGAFRGALGIGESKAADGSPVGPSLSDGAPTADGTGAAAPSAVQSSMDELRAVVGAVDLTSEGERIMASLEAGIRNGTAGVVAAMEAATAGIRGAANTVNLNVGPSMQGSK